MPTNKSENHFSRLGFILAAAGSGIGLADLYIFPIQVVKNGGAVFILVYLVLTLVIVYPALVAEISIGRYARSNAVDIFVKLGGTKYGRIIGFVSLASVMLILSFYAVMGGEFILYFFRKLCQFLGLMQGNPLLPQYPLLANIIGMFIFYLFTVSIIIGGLKSGIETWSKVLIPTLLLLLVGLTVYMLSLPGASKGVQFCFSPDFSKIFDLSLLVNAMSQAFLSASLGIAIMIVYGSYLPDNASIPKLGALVLICDFLVAFLAGLLIISGLYVIEEADPGSVFQNGELIEEQNVIFKIFLPKLFVRMGPVGSLALACFFLLMLFVSLTPAISMLEVPVSYVVDKKYAKRTSASWAIVSICASMSVLIICFRDALFEPIVTLTTTYLQPIVSILYCVLVGWFLNKKILYKELSKGDFISSKSSLLGMFRISFRYVVPIGIGIILLRALFFSN